MGGTKNGTLIWTYALRLKFSSPHTSPTASRCKDDDHGDGDDGHDDDDFSSAKAQRAISVPAISPT